MKNMNCSKCGTEILTDTKFCPVCGFNLEIDKKLEQLVGIGASKPPRETAMCYCPAPDYELDNKTGKPKKKKPWGCILIIAAAFIVGVLIFYMLK